MTQPRAADDFEVIRERLEQLRREREEIADKTGDTAPASEGDGDTADGEAEREAQCQGAPPAWVPTIFLPQPTD